MGIPNYYLGIDGGGTKTEAVIVDKNGTVLGRGLAGGSNLHNFPLDSAIEHIRRATNAACANMYQNHNTAAPLSCLTTCIGLAGLDTPNDRRKITRFFSDIPSIHWPIHTERLLITNDGLIGLKSGTNKPWGICLVSSTGSNCYGINQAGQEASAGDWGHLLGDQGSAYAIGLKLVRIVMKEFDGRRPQSVLTGKVLTHLKLKSVPELVSFAYSGQPPVETIASLTHLYADSELSENEDLLRMIQSCSGELTSAYQSVVQRLDIAAIPFPVVLIGGLFNLTKQLTQRVITRIKKVTPQVEIIQPTQTPAVGAAQLAIESDTLTYPESIISHLVA